MNNEFYNQDYSSSAKLLAAELIKAKIHQDKYLFGLGKPYTDNISPVRERTLGLFNMGPEFKTGNEYGSVSERKTAVDKSLRNWLERPELNLGKTDRERLMKQMMKNSDVIASKMDSAIAKSAPGNEMMAAETSLMNQTARYKDIVDKNLDITLREQSDRDRNESTKGSVDVEARVNGVGTGQAVNVPVRTGLDEEKKNMESRVDTTKSMFDSYANAAGKGALNADAAYVAMMAAYRERDFSLAGKYGVMEHMKELSNAKFTGDELKAGKIEQNIRTHIREFLEKGNGNTPQIKNDYTQTVSNAMKMNVEMGLK